MTKLKARASVVFIGQRLNPNTTTAWRILMTKYELEKKQKITILHSYVITSY